VIEDSLWHVSRKWCQVNMLYLLVSISKKKRWFLILLITLCKNASKILRWEVREELAIERDPRCFVEEDKALKSRQRTCSIPHFYLVKIVVMRILIMMLISILFPLPNLFFKSHLISYEFTSHVCSYFRCKYITWTKL
jgi:hypothetical protein